MLGFADAFLCPVRLAFSEGCAQGSFGDLITFSKSCGSSGGPELLGSLRKRHWGGHITGVYITESLAGWLVPKWSYK